MLEDLALSFELLRLVNSAQVRGAQISGSGPVLTVRRAIAMLGMDGVRRAALALRPWPGPLNDTGAADLQRLIDRCKRAGRVALVLRPAGNGQQVACHFFEQLPPPPDLGITGGMAAGKLAERLALFESAKQDTHAG